MMRDRRVARRARKHATTLADSEASACLQGRRVGIVRKRERVSAGDGPHAIDMGRRWIA